MKKVTGIDADLIVYSASFCVEAKEKEGNYLNWYQVSKIVNTIVQSILWKSKATHYLGFLTDGKSNFRNKRATTLEYKGQRKTNKEKPAFYDEIRDYLVKHWGFQMMYGIEADDALVITGEYFKDKDDVEYTLATKDKDLWQWEGNHFNMNDDTLFSIDAETAHRNLWRQVILGDMSTDNIPGVSHAAKWGVPYYLENPKKRPLAEFLVGKVAAEKMLDEWEPEEYAAKILQLYIDSYGEDELGDDFGEYRFYETFDLVYMLRELPEGVTIDYTPIKNKKGAAYEGESITELEF